MNDPVWLSRVQFAVTVAYHYLFPPLSIGLGVLLVIMEGMYIRTRDRQYEAMAKFWTRIFAIIFAMGVATGIVMEFEFGTNWARYSRFVGDIFGSALAAEGIFAFFLESGFLAVLVFGWEKVSPRMHFVSTIMVAAGSLFSAIWIIVANSWQQTPAGYQIVAEGLLRRAELTSFAAAVLNPSTINRLVHTLFGAFILGAFFVMSVSAYYLLKGRHELFARRSIKIALPMATIFSIAQLLSGHANSRMVGNNQPAKLAAFEGHFRSESQGAPLHLFGIVDEDQQRVTSGVAIPGLLSFLMYNNWSRPVIALDDPRIVPGGLRAGETVRDYWPPVQASFQTYHLMVALGMFFIALTLLSSILWWRGTLFHHRWLLWIFVFAVIGPVVANQVGWAAAEIGRQPWIVWGLLRTRDGVSASVSAAEVLTSIVVFGVIYLLLLLVWLYIMNHKIKAGPESPEELAAEAAQRDFLGVATQRPDHGGTMTDAKQ